ncbi:ATP-binding protein [Sedimentitalea sp. JM2-8]|uniref:ATP-binding protein n=1 Tax=Sedimentitalea xiamensis TaxID=3050037 RepID=A0ABT7F9M9_9RHOB|nr:ATP-binding protein [Sedimentitalea xiamensis]MDK3071564.1 ATP-binding protein [Sedimentitalea xiamensis]
MTDAATGFSHRFRATELDARAALCEIIGTLQARGLVQEQIGAVEIALAEVINNIVEHAYAGTAPGDIVVDVAFREAILKLTTTDGGKPLPDGRLPEGRPADVTGAVDDLPEGGFGWFMIRTLARDISYARENDRNRLELTFDVVPAVDRH